MSSLSVQNASKKEGAAASTAGSQASTAADEQEDQFGEQEAKPYACEDDACLETLLLDS
jgi:hypothetical protein